MEEKEVLEALPDEKEVLEAIPVEKEEEKEVLEAVPVEKVVKLSEKELENLEKEKFKADIDEFKRGIVTDQGMTTEY